MQKKTKKSAAAFIEKYGLNKETLTVSRLREIIESLDFVVVDYRSNVKKRFRCNCASGENKVDRISFIYEKLRLLHTRRKICFSLYGYVSR